MSCFQQITGINTIIYYAPTLSGGGGATNGIGGFNGDLDTIDAIRQS
jgi:hypothetical protein